MERAAIEAMESEHDFFVSMDLLVCTLEHLGIRCNIPFSFVDIAPRRAMTNSEPEIYGRSPLLDYLDDFIKINICLRSLSG